MRTIALVAAVTVLALGLSATAAPATTVEQCQAQIAALQAATTDPAVTTITGKQAETKDRPGLVAKLETAAAALPDKPATAIAKLTDYRAKVQQLIDAGRLQSSVDLVAGADAAIACVEAIGT